MSLKFKKALVTGASRGLGAELVRQLEAQGVECIKLSSATHDLKIHEERLKLLQLIDEKKPDLIINNAGFGLYGPFDQLDLEMQSNMIEVNCIALMEITHAGINMMKRSGIKGTIMNISSGAGELPFPYFSVYSASKAFVTQLTRCIDFELEGSGIRVLASLPGQIGTDFRKRAAQGAPQQRERHHLLSAEKAANLILNQIKSGKRIQVIDGQFRHLLWIARCLPQRFSAKILGKNILKRIEH